MLALLFAALGNDELIQIKLIRPHPSGDKSQDEIRTQYFTNVADALANARAAPPGFNSYFGVLPKSRPSARAEAATQAYCIWADLDAKLSGSEDAALAALSRFALPASAVVYTGGGYHAYWFLSSTIRHHARVSDLVRRLARLIGADSTADVARILRVPGTYNYKYNPPREVKQHSLRDLKYLDTDFEAALGVSPEVVKRIWTGDKTGFKSRSERDWAVVGALVAAGVSEQTIRIVYDNMPVGDKHRESPGGQYLSHTIRTAADRVKAARPVTAVRLDSMISSKDGVLHSSSKSLHAVATFDLLPTRLLLGESEDVLECTVVAGSRAWQRIPFPKSAFDNTRAMQSKLTSAYWQWLGSDNEARHVAPYLMGLLAAKGCPTAHATRTLGRHGTSFVSIDEVVRPDGIVPPENSDVVFIHSGREIPRTRYVTSDPADVRAAAARAIPLLFQLNTPQVMYTTVGWYTAALMKPVIEHLGHRFPSLHLSGPRGSGKTTLLMRVLQRLVGYEYPTAYSCGTTRFVLMALLSSSNAIPVSFAEFRRSTLIGGAYEQILRLILLAYDVGYDARGRPDQTTISYPLSAPFTVDGEDMVTDPAALERMMYAVLSPMTIVEGTPAWEAFRAWNEDDAVLLATPLVQYTLGLDSSAVAELWKEASVHVRTAIARRIPDRVRANMTVVALGLQVFANFAHTQGVEVPIPWEEAFEEHLQSVVGEHETTRLAIDELTEWVANEAARGTTSFAYKFDEQFGVLWFQLTPAYHAWRAALRREGTSVVELAAVKRQAVERVVGVKIASDRYLHPPQVTNMLGRSVWAHGIDLAQAISFGMDVPASFRNNVVLLTVPQTLS